MPCPPPDALRAMSTGQLNDSESGEIVEHIRQCDQCRDDLEKFDGGDDSLIVSLRQPEAPSPFEREPNCQAAMAKALGALATSRDPHSDQASPAGDRGAKFPPAIAEYDIVGPLGSGGMGRVFLAQHTKLGRRVAVKLLADHRLDDPKTRQRFEAEMRAVGRLSHPNIVTAHDARDVDGMAVLVTEYIDGVDLGELVRRTGPLGVDRRGIADACELICQVAHALAYTSEQGFVHRDVKPSNIMLSSSGEVKLLDLGLARFQSSGDESMEMTGTGQTMGTADYMAPEQIGDSRAVDVRADIYSLGCTLFKLLTGFAPFADEAHGTAFAKMTAHVATKPPTLADTLGDIPPELSRFVDQMLAKRPEQRPATPADVSRFLAPFSQGSDLPGLAERVAMLTPKPAEKRASSVSQGNSHATRKSLFRRQVPMIVAIATGMLGLLAGLVLGIVITVTLPDGSQIAMTVPEGSDIDIRNSGDRGQEQAVQGTSPQRQEQVVQGTLPRGKAYPLAFAVLLEGPQITPDEWKREWKQFLLAIGQNDFEGPVVTESGAWFPSTTLLPPSGMHRGRRYSMVRHDTQGFIGSDEIDPNTGVIISSGAKNELRFSFGPSLAPRMAEVTRENVGKKLAIILRDRIVSAPIIRGEYRDGDTISGFFRIEDLELLRDPFTGLLDEPWILPSGERGRSASGTFSSWPFWGFFGGSQGVTDGDAAQPAPTQRQARAPSEPSPREHFRQIGVAFHYFHEVFQKFPGSANMRDGGRGASPEFPFSWRVAILPFIEQNELFEQYRFNEPWDSPHNLTLLDKMPDVYRSPRAVAEGIQVPNGHTHYLGFVGDSTALGPRDGERMQSFTDGTSGTILIVESTTSKPWTAPEDIPFTGLEDAANVKPFAGQPLHFLTADGAFYSMDPIDHERLGKLITRNGGEQVRP